MSEIYRFTFKDSVPSKGIEETLFWAVFNAESVFGKPKVRLDASFYFERDKNVCVIDKSTDVGEHIAKVFTSMISVAFGEKSFAVERLLPKESVENAKG